MLPEIPLIATPPRKAWTAAYCIGALTEVYVSLATDAIADIYNVVESIDEIEDSLVIGQDWEDDVRVILFVKLRRGVELTENMIKKINTNIRSNCSPRHVPAKVIAIADIPYTINNKKVELAVRQIIHGQPVLNQDSLKNPESLDLFRNLPERPELKKKRKSC